MPAYPVIGIAGPARSGKDTVANFIIALLGGYQYSFAGPLKAMLVPLGIDLTDPYWDSRKEDKIPALGVSPRFLLQTLGTEWGRQLVNPDLWIIMAQQRLVQRGVGMVVSDVRFENEAAWVRRHKGLVIHLVRPDAPGVEPHISEAGLQVEPADFRLFNRGTLEDLQYAVRGIFHGEET